MVKHDETCLLHFWGHHFGSWSQFANAGASASGHVLQPDLWPRTEAKIRKKQHSLGKLWDFGGFRWRWQSSGKWMNMVPFMSAKQGNYGVQRTASWSIRGLSDQFSQKSMTSHIKIGRDVSRSLIRQIRRTPSPDTSPRPCSVLRNPSFISMSFYVYTTIIYVYKLYKVKGVNVLIGFNHHTSPSIKHTCWRPHGHCGAPQVVSPWLKPWSTTAHCKTCCCAPTSWEMQVRHGETPSGQMWWLVHQIFLVRFLVRHM